MLIANTETEQVVREQREDEQHRVDVYRQGVLVEHTRDGQPAGRREPWHDDGGHPGTYHAA